jgi:uncharacterized protein (DUF2147 family)
LFLAKRAAGAVMGGLKKGCCPLRRGVCAASLILLLLSWGMPKAAGSAGGPDGVWLMPSKVALQIFDCSGLLCGRIVWLQYPRNPAGQLARDKENPNPALRQRLMCGQTVLWGLQSAGPNHWQGGWLYNPDDGRTYRIKAELRSQDTFVARIYLGIPLFGENRTLVRIPRLTSEGWC